MPRATVIIPTFGEARFAEWAIRSVQDQTVEELEICVICDGSPPHMVALLRELAAHDPRVMVFAHPKSPRTGEPYRDEAIRQTSGTIICYCAHDDLWLPYHVEAVEQTLASNHFTHSIHAAVNTPEDIRRTGELFSRIYLGDLKDPASLAGLRANVNFFGLTYGAHTRVAYSQLAEGWVTTPVDDTPTDLYMWQKFIAAFPESIATTQRITALNFSFAPRQSWSESARSEELEGFYERISTAESLYGVQEAAAVQLYRQLYDQTRRHESLGREYESLRLKQASLRYLTRRLGIELSRRLRPRPGSRGDPLPDAGGAVRIPPVRVVGSRQPRGIVVKVYRLRRPSH